MFSIHGGGSIPTSSIKSRSKCYRSADDRFSEQENNTMHSRQKSSQKKSPYNKRTMESVFWPFRPFCPFAESITCVFSAPCPRPIPSLATIVFPIRIVAPGPSPKTGSGFRLSAPGRKGRGLTPPKRLKFDSVPGHHQNPSEIIKLLTGLRLYTSYVRRTAGLPSKTPFSREPICANFALPLRSALIQEWSEESAHASRLY